MSFGDVRIVGDSDIGRLRPRNEDSLVLEEEAHLAVVADGMGGHPGGDAASRIAAKSASEALLRGVSTLGPAPDAPQDRLAGLRAAMAESVLEAQAAVRAAAEETRQLRGMGTTPSILLIDRPTESWVVGNVGDSRIYRLRGEDFRQLTKDDTWVQARVDEELLSPEQARDHPFGHMLSQCVGLDAPPTPRVLSGPVAAGDVFLLCTDGLTGMLADAVLAEELQATDATRVEKSVEKLIGLANRAGGRDNITVALVVVG
jgi:protein phosphatase